MQTVATCYIGMVKADGQAISENYINEYVGKMMDSTFSWSLQLPLVTSYTSTAGAYKRIVSNQYDTILNSFLVPALMSIGMQKIALDFINENMVNWVLPSAFVLRFFIPTRHMGNLLIALVVGVYVLVPFMYVFGFAMYDALLTTGDCDSFKAAVYDFHVDGGSDVATCGNPNSFWHVARLIPQAFFLPNLTIVVLITFLTAMHKALTVIG
jgi:hypothetical protein